MKAFVEVWSTWIQALVRVQFSLVPAFVFDQLRVVFTVVRILFFIDRMTAASVLAVAVRMIDLCMARSEKAPAKLREPIGESNINEQTV